MKLTESKLRSIIREELNRIQEARVGGSGEMDYGFGLTEFPSPRAFEVVLDELGLRGPKKEATGYGTEQYVFETDGLRLVTSENPFEEPEPGYASYMGITGEPRKVQRLVDEIKEKAVYIKGEDPGTRSYI